MEHHSGDPGFDPAQSTNSAAQQGRPGLSNDFFDGITPLYGPGQANQDQPFGIGWDHPVFQGGPHAQQHQHQHQQPQAQHGQPIQQVQQVQQLHQQQAQPSPQQLQPSQPQPQKGHPQPQQGPPQQHDFFAPPWPQQQNPLHASMGPSDPLSNYHFLSPFPVEEFPQPAIQRQGSFESNQAAMPPFNPYAFEQHQHFMTSHIPPQENLQRHGLPLHPQLQPQQAPQQQQQSHPPPQQQAQPHSHQPQPQQPHHQHGQQPAGGPKPHPQFLSSNAPTDQGGLHPNAPDFTVRFSSSFQEPQIKPTSFHHTIDPQFLTSPQPQSQGIPAGQTQQNQFVVNPADLERNDQALGSIAAQLSAAAASQQAAPQPRPIVAKGQPGVPLAPKPENAPQKQKGSTAKTKPATKKAAAKPAGATKTQSKSKASSESDSSDSSEDEEPEASPLPSQRPEDPEAGIKYDALKAVWSPRNKHAQLDKVRSSMVAYSDLVKGIRDTWKGHSEALKAAENQNQEGKIPAIKRDVIFQRRMIDLVVNVALESGHPAIVRRFGEHPMIVSAFYSFLLDRHIAADSEGALTVNILKLMAKFTTIDQDMLEKTKNDKILSRFVKKGGDTIKQLATTILDNAEAATKRKKERQNAKSMSMPGKDGNKASDSDTAAKNQTPSQAQAKGQAATLGVKRPRETDNTGDRPGIKKAVAPANAKPAAAAANAKKTATTGAQKNVKAGQNQANQAAKQPRANIVTPKPALNYFSSLMSASKKPGTSNAARAAAAAAAKEKENAEQKQSPPKPAASRPAFSFSETMADLSRPREPTPTKPEEERPPETEEEKAKRLRKEERRKLKVHFKPDESLVEVRYFTHDPEEELGHEDSMMRDVSDVAGEGRMLKLHRGMEDFEDEEERAKGEILTAWRRPTNADLGILGEERYRNFTKTGGFKEPDSAQKRAQEQREANTLSVFHLSPADVPRTPKEPPPPSADEPYNPESPFGQPDEKTKARSDKYFASRAPPAPKQQNAQTGGAGNMDVASLLRILQQGNQQNQQQQPQAPQQQAAFSQQQQQSSMSELEKTFAQFRTNSTPQQAQPIAPPPVSQPAQTAAGGQGIDLQKIMAIVNAQQQMQQQPQQPQQLQQPAMSQPPAQGQGPNLASILAQFTNPSGGQSQQPQSQYSQQGYGQQYGQQQRPPYHEDPARKRNYDGFGGGRRGYDGSDDSGPNESNSHKRFRINGDPNKPKKHPKAGLVPCRYWKEGKCIKGDDCTFRHDPLD